VRCRVVRHHRGAVLIEFLVAIIPMLMIFFSIAQISALGYTSLLVHHAAYVAARAYAVVHPGIYDSGPPSDVQSAAGLVLARVPGNLSVTTRDVDPMSEQLATTTVTLDYPCGVPLGAMLVCGASMRRTLTAQASFPNQGSYVQQVWGE